MIFFTIWICSGLIALMIAYQIVFDLKKRLDSIGTKENKANIEKLANTEVSFQSVLLSMILGPIHLIFALLLWREVRKMLKVTKK